MADTVSDMPEQRLLIIHPISVQMYASVVQLQPLTIRAVLLKAFKHATNGFCWWTPHVGVSAIEGSLLAIDADAVAAAAAYVILTGGFALSRWERCMLKWKLTCHRK